MGGGADRVEPMENDEGGPKGSPGAGGWSDGRAHAKLIGCLRTSLSRCSSAILRTSYFGMFFSPPVTVISRSLLYRLYEGSKE